MHRKLAGKSNPIARLQASQRLTKTAPWATHRMPSTAETLKTAEGSNSQRVVVTVKEDPPSGVGTVVASAKAISQTVPSAARGRMQEADGVGRETSRRGRGRSSRCIALCVCIGVNRGGSLTSGRGHPNSCPCPQRRSCLVRYLFNYQRALHASLNV